MATGFKKPGLSKKPNLVAFIGLFGQAGKIGKIIQKLNLKP